MKRFHARGRGRGSTIIKPFSQLTVVVRQVEQEKVEKKPAKKSATKSAKPTDQKAAKKPAAKSKEGQNTYGSKSQSHRPSLRDQQNLG